MISLVQWSVTLLWGALSPLGNKVAILPVRLSWPQIGQLKFPLSS
jgi:hypothetical protein